MSGKAESDSRWREISLVLTDDAGIAEINRRLFGRDSATDVISQAYAPMPGEGDAQTGEIVVNAERAVALGKKGYWTASHELALYIAHGCDHLAGGRDSTAEGRRRMRRRELRWLRLIAGEGFPGKLITPHPKRRMRRKVRNV